MRILPSVRRSSLLEHTLLGWENVNHVGGCSLKLRAFVVIPFGSQVNVQTTGGPNPIQGAVDFKSVYTRLIEPALRAAGCDTVRADSESSAGDIRTDMFFELVTADVVVADLSIPMRMFTMSSASAMASARGACSLLMADGQHLNLLMSPLIVPLNMTASCSCSVAFAPRRGRTMTKGSRTQPQN